MPLSNITPFKDEKDYNHESDCNKHLSDFKAIFQLAEIEVTDWIAIPNGYYGATMKAPYWYFAETDYVLIQIGWRKRVISID